MARAGTARGSQGSDLLFGFSHLGLLVFLPSDAASMVEEGYQKIKELWTPIFDVYDQCGVKLALEIHPTEIAFDYYSTKKLLDVLEWRPTLGNQFRPVPPALAGDGSGCVFERFFQPHLSCPHEGCQNEPGWKKWDSGQPH